MKALTNKENMLKYWIWKKQFINSLPYHYILIREDLPHGLQAAQITHAAGESILSPVPPGTSAVVLAVPNETKLRELAKKLQLSGIPHICIHENDPPYDCQMMAIGIVPTVDRQAIKKICSSLPLLGARSSNAARGSKPTSSTTCNSSSMVEHQE